MKSGINFIKFVCLICEKEIANKFYVINTIPEDDSAFADGLAFHHECLDKLLEGFK